MRLCPGVVCVPGLGVRMRNAVRMEESKTGRNAR